MSTAMKKTKTTKRVQFSEFVEMCRDLGRERICWDNLSNPILFRNMFGEKFSLSLLRCEVGKGFISL